MPCSLVVAFASSLSWMLYCGHRFLSERVLFRYCAAIFVVPAVFGLRRFLRGERGDGSARLYVRLVQAAGTFALPVTFLALRSQCGNQAVGSRARWVLELKTRYPPWGLRREICRKTSGDCSICHTKQPGLLARTGCVFTMCIG